MDLGSIFLVLALLILVGLFISRPFLERKPLMAAPEISRQEDHELSSLMAERDRILNALQELDFDYALGKIPEEDYPGQRSVLLQRGADTLRRLDALQGASQVEEVGERAEDRLEAVIAARRADASRQTAGGNGHAAGRSGARVAGTISAEAEDDLEVMLAQRRRLRQEKLAGFCPQCGGPVQKSDRFCPKCGANLNKA